MSRNKKFSSSLKPQRMYIYFILLSIWTFFSHLIICYWIACVKSGIAATLSTSNQEDVLSYQDVRPREKLQIHLYLISPSTSQKCTSVVDIPAQRMLYSAGIREEVMDCSSWQLLPLFLLHLPVTVLCASSTKNIIPFCLYENQIDFCQWKYSLHYWWIGRQACCSDHLPESAWNLELSRKSARGAISALFICIFHTYLFTQKEQKAFTLVGWLWANK